MEYYPNNILPLYYNTSVLLSIYIDMKFSCQAVQKKWSAGRIGSLCQFSLLWIGQSGKAETGLVGQRLVWHGKGKLCKAQEGLVGQK